MGRDEDEYNNEPQAYLLKMRLGEGRSPKFNLILFVHIVKYYYLFDTFIIYI